jgi:hypothetical protein
VGYVQNSECDRDPNCWRDTLSPYAEGLEIVKRHRQHAVTSATVLHVLDSDAVDHPTRCQ